MKAQPSTHTGAEILAEINGEVLEATGRGPAAGGDPRTCEHGVPSDHDYEHNGQVLYCVGPAEVLDDAGGRVEITSMDPREGRRTMTPTESRAAAAASGSSVPVPGGMDLQRLIDSLVAARDVADEHGLGNAGAVRFRFAIAYGELAGSGFGEVDPFGPIVAVTLTADGTTLVDITPEAIEAKQGGLFA